MKPPVNQYDETPDRTPFVFDQELNTRLPERLENNQTDLNRTLLLKNLGNPVHSEFRKKAQEKFQKAQEQGTLAPGITSDCMPAQFVEKNMVLGSRQAKTDSPPHMQVHLVVRALGEKAGDLQFGLWVGPWFISFDSSGLVTCDTPFMLNVGKGELLCEQLQVLKNGDDITRLITNLANYLITCNGCMDYSKEHFNDAHFIKYFLEEHGLWDAVSKLGKEYITHYCTKQRLPHAVSIDSGVVYQKIPQFDGLCKHYGVTQEPLFGKDVMILRASDSKHLETLFNKVIPPDLYAHFSDIKDAVELIRCMVMKQYGFSEMKEFSNSFGPFKGRYNWAGREACITALAKRYGTETVRIEDNREHSPLVRSSVHVLPIQKLLAGADKKDVGNAVELKFYGLVELKQTQQELLKIGVSNGRLSSEPRKVTYEQEGEKDVFTMNLSKVEYEAIMGGTQEKPLLEKTQSMKSLSEQEAQITGHLGPRSLAGWVLHDMNDEGNCFYDAVAHQLERIGHEFVKQNKSATPLHTVLRLLVQGAERFQDKEWAGDAELAIVSNRLNLVVAVVDTRYPQRGYVYYYTDEQGTECIAFDALHLPNKPMIKLAYTGNHFLSVNEEPGNKKVTHHLKQTQVDNLFTKPEVITLPPECTQLTIGDLHANLMLLLCFLVSHDVVEISAENYSNLAEIYQKGAHLSNEQFEQFNAIIESLEIKNKHRLIRLIGDEVADRGQNDYFILKLLAKLHQEGVALEILASNHGGEFIMLNEQRDFSQSFLIYPFQSCSAKNLHTLLDKKMITRELLDELIKTAYLPKVKLVSYSVDSEGAISIYTHAPASINEAGHSPFGDNSIAQLAALFNIEYDISSMSALIKTIDGINEQFCLRLQNQQAFKLFEEHAPISNFIWARRTPKQQDTLPHGYTTSFIHGHTRTGTNQPNVHNLDWSLGKELKDVCGTLKTLISSGAPALSLTPPLVDSLRCHKQALEELEARKGNQTRSQESVEPLNPLSTDSNSLKDKKSLPEPRLQNDSTRNLFFKQKPADKFDDFIQKLEEDMALMEQHCLKLNFQIKNFEERYQRALVNEFAAPELPLFWRSEQEKAQYLLENHLVAIVAQHERIKTLKQIRQGNAISQAQHEQLMRIETFQQDEHIVNYPHVLVSNSIQHN